MLIDYCMKDSSYFYCHETVKHGGNYTKGPSSHGISSKSSIMKELLSSSNYVDICNLCPMGAWAHATCYPWY